MIDVFARIRIMREVAYRILEIGNRAALVGGYFLVGGLVNLAIQPNITALIADVRNGTRNFTLTKPEDSRLLTSIRDRALMD